MSENIVSNKSSKIFNDGILTQLKKDDCGFKIITHLNHLKDPINAHVADRFDMHGNYLGNDFGD